MYTERECRKGRIECGFEGTENKVSGFDDLMKIIGPKLSDEVMNKMGGRLIRIRKRMDIVLEVYLADQFFYDSISVKEAAEKLRCGRHTVSVMRSREPKNYE